MQGYLGAAQNKTAAGFCRMAGTTPADVAHGGRGWFFFADHGSASAVFSKIGGEDGPTPCASRRSSTSWRKVTEQTFVVAGVPDEKKGERLIVLHKLKET